MNNIHRRDGQFQRDLVAAVSNVAKELKRFNDREELPPQRQMLGPEYYFHVNSVDDVARLTDTKLQNEPYHGKAGPSE